MHIKTLDRLTIIFLTFCISLVSLYFIPFEWFVDVRSEQYQDVCVGEHKQWVHADRTPRWGIEGEVFAQVVRFDGQNILETTIDRQDLFGYEPDTHTSYFQVSWSEPFEEVGEYGANSWVSIFPFPFVTTKTFFGANDTRFNVINCGSPVVE